MMSVHKNKMDEGSESKSQEMKQEAGQRQVLLANGYRAKFELTGSSHLWSAVLE